MLYRILVPVALACLVSGNALAQPAAQKDSANGVTVAVTPGNLAADAKVWDFAIVFDTHSQDLSDDVIKAATLVDNQGNQFKPVAWQGAAPGGHHREGVLKFEAVTPRPQTVELRIARPGEAKPRSFRWNLE
jgi:hypothetical protein